MARSVVHFNKTQNNVNIITSIKADNHDDVTLEASGCCSLSKIDISSYVDACPPHVKFMVKAKPGCSMNINFTLDGCQEPNNFFNLHYSVPLGKI